MIINVPNKDTHNITVTQCINDITRRIKLELKLEKIVIHDPPPTLIPVLGIYILIQTLLSLDSSTISTNYTHEGEGPITIHHVFIIQFKN